MTRALPSVVGWIGPFAIRFQRNREAARELPLPCRESAVGAWCAAAARPEWGSAGWTGKEAGRDAERSRVKLA